jgi:2-keto-4-pentenoate hydratase
MLAAGARLLGWKIAASIPGVRPDDGVGGLIFGYLTSDTAMNAGGSFRPDTTVQLCAEVELAVVIGRDVEPDTDLEMAVDAVIGLAVALEIVDVDENISMDQAVAGNVFHRAVAIGSMSSPASWQSVTAVLLVDGTVRASEMVAVNPGPNGAADGAAAGCLRSPARSRRHDHRRIFDPSANPERSGSQRRHQLTVRTAPTAHDSFR